MTPIDIVGRLALTIGDDLSADSAFWAYVVIWLMIALDGVIPVFPGETTLTVGATLAATGDLHIMLVILAGILGAATGDGIVYAIGRGGQGRIEHLVLRFAGEKNLTTARGYFDRNVPLALMFGRFVPGLRLLISLTAGARPVPLRRYAVWELVGCTLWSLQVSLLAYFLRSALDGRALLSMLISGAITAAVVAVIASRERRRARREASAGAVAGA